MADSARRRLVEPGGGFTGETSRGREVRRIEVDSVNEQAVLGAALVDPEARKLVVRKLAPETFLAKQHQAIALALRECANAALEPTAEALATYGDQREWGGTGYVDVLRASAAPKKNLARHVEALEWDALRARLVNGGAHAALTEALTDPRATPDAVQAALRSLEGSIKGWGGRRYMRDGPVLARAWRAELAVRRAGGGFFSMGYPALDNLLTEGFCPARVTVIAGLSGMGKSTFAANLVLQQAELGERVLLGAWEMGSLSVMDVMVSIRTGIPIVKLVKAKAMTDEESEFANAEAEWICARVRFMDNPFFAPLSSSGASSNEKNLDTLAGYIAESGCSVVVMDLWERMLAKRDPDRDVAPALHRTHKICEEYGVHGVILQQLKLKDVEKRADKRPTREAVKGTAAYVEVADQLFGVHREAPFKPQIPDDSFEVICMKQRKGRGNWLVRFSYDPETGRISGGEERPYDPGEAGASDIPGIDGPSRYLGSPGTRRRRPNREG